MCLQIVSSCLVARSSEQSFGTEWGKTWRELSQEDRDGYKEMAKRKKMDGPNTPQEKRAAISQQLKAIDSAVSEPKSIISIVFDTRFFLYVLRCTPVYLFWFSWALLGLSHLVYITCN